MQVDFVRSEERLTKRELFNFASNEKSDTLVMVEIVLQILIGTEHDRVV